MRDIRARLSRVCGTKYAVMFFWSDMTPVECLQQLESNLHRLPVPLACWLKAGLRRYQHDMSLEAALELAGPGARRHRDTVY